MLSVPSPPIPHSRPAKKFVQPIPVHRANDLETETCDVESQSQRKGLIAKLGPGLITGASDDDPSGIATYAQAGASTGYSMLWVIFLTTPMMAVVQGMCARIAMVTGKGLAAAMRQKLPRLIVAPLGIAVIIANTVNA